MFFDAAGIAKFAKGNIQIPVSGPFLQVNSEGVGTPLLEGPITMGDAIECLPFSNTVVMLDMTGAEIRKVLNEAAWYSLNSGSTSAFHYAAGLRYDVDLSGGEGDVIFNIEMLDEETGTWTAIDENATFTVATNSFTALGKDNYLTFKDVRDADPTKFEDTYITYYIPSLILLSFRAT
ncbi:5'-nucleotidase [uncultured Desulfobacter sp.]|uniref:5'-nucleotidase n=1 Tax=uncultured Desulfobacter sp. TaxID=240139 RepID=UPI002AA92E68|nr:5'-nucleotidase [uncultured Desulfobacter sp.]